jgi:hypothetical protein
LFASFQKGTQEGQPVEGVCVTLASHWSYIGIGWNLGLESCVLSVTDAMEMTDRPPHVKTLINLDARAYELMAEKFPEVAERLKKYLAAGTVALALRVAGAAETNLLGSKVGEVARDGGRLSFKIQP